MAYLTLDIGLNEEQKDQIEKYIKKNFVSLSHYEKKCEEYEDKIQGMVQTSKNSKKLEEEYQKNLQELDSLRLQFSQVEQKHQTEINNIKLEYAVNDFLKLNGARNIKLVRDQLDYTKLNLKKDGSVSGLEEQVKAMKQDKNYDFCFYPDRFVSEGNLNQHEEPLYQSAPEVDTKAYTPFEQRLNALTKSYYQK